MATTSSASLDLALRLLLAPDTDADGREGPIKADTVQSDRWVQGTASGQVDRPYKRVRSIGAGSTDSYNTLAAGALRDIDGQIIDLDEMKALVLRCLTGSIRLVASAGTPIDLFAAAGDGLNISAGHAIAVSFGAEGLDVTVNSLFEITETTGAATASYELSFVGAQ
jgi:hypothetical protein